jgi:hypothetical protein
VVAQESWSSWRSIEEIREVSLLERTFTWAGGPADICPGLPQDAVRRAHEAGEALLLAMHAATIATRATFGLVHRIRAPFVGLVTSAARGTNRHLQLGEVLPHLDPALELARAGQPLMRAIDAETRSPAEDAVVRRFAASGADLRGIAMVPIFDQQTLLAMIELARTDHPFRDGDAAVLASIAALVSEK